MDTNLMLCLAAALAMTIVAIVAVVYWRRISLLQIRWFWAGAGLWTIAVILKTICALLTNKAVFEFMKEKLSYPLFVFGGGLFLGIQSSLFEIGLTLLAVLIWRQLGKDAGRATGIGIGAGSFEAFLLGISSLTAVLVLFAGLPGTEKFREGITAAATTTPVFWLLGPSERIMAILCHTSSRALVLLGVTNRRPMMIFGGFLIFTLLDSIAGVAHVSGIISRISMWWIELAILPLALVSIPILKWCYANWGQRKDDIIKKEVAYER